MDTVKRFLDAWAAQDLESVLNIFDESATFKASMGPEPGKTYIGHDEIKPAVRSMFENAAGTQFDITELFLFDGGAVVTWCVTSQVNGETVRSPGIDVFRVRNGKITLKDAYRKLKV